MKKIKTKWNLGLLFDNISEIEKERNLVIKNTQKFVDKWKGKTDYLEKEDILKEALSDYEEWEKLYGCNCREVYYYLCKNSQDQNDPKIRAGLNKAEELSRKIANEMEFFSLSLGKIKPEDQEKFLKSEALKDYRYFLKKIFIKAKYFLSEKEERILNLKESTAYDNWVMMTSSLLSKEEKVVLGEDKKKKERTFEEIMTLISNKKKTVRDGAAKALNEILSKYSDIAEIEINSVLHDKKVNDELRGLERPDKARHVGDGIDSEIVDILIDSVKNRFDISSRYYRLKAKILGVDKLEYHERNVECGNINKKYSYEEAFNSVDKVLGNLDPEFSKILNDFNNNGQIDAFPKKGKHGGAYCNHALITHPTYILLNHTDELNDVLTLAHEVGHGINNELMKKKQNSLSFGSSLAVAEVASTFMEDFVLDDILEDANDELRFSILMHKVGGDVSTIQRQIACYLFEKDLHEEFRKKGYLSKEEIGTIFLKNMKAYMGNYVRQSEGAENWWIYWSHIRSYFYVYSYASGLLIAKSLQNSVKKDKDFIIKVKAILSAGLSDSPKNIFDNVGIDITDKSFWNNGLEEIDNSLKEVERLAKKLKKI
jgi:oligoendopeptidase F